MFFAARIVVGGRVGVVRRIVRGAGRTAHHEVGARGQAAPQWSTFATDAEDDFWAGAKGSYSSSALISAVPVDDDDEEDSLDIQQQQEEVARKIAARKIKQAEYLVLLRRTAIEGLPAEATQILENMQREGIPPDANLYIAAMASVIDNFDHVKELLASMEREKVPRKFADVTVEIRLYEKHQMWEEALELQEFMMEAIEKMEGKTMLTLLMDAKDQLDKVGVLPTHVMYYCLLELRISTMELRRAYVLIKEMKHNEVAFSDRQYRAVKNLCLKHEFLEEAANLEAMYDEDDFLALTPPEETNMFDWYVLVAAGGRVSRANNQSNAKLPDPNELTEAVLTDMAPDVRDILRNIKGSVEGLHDEVATLLSVGKEDDGNKDNEISFDGDDGAFDVDREVAALQQDLDEVWESLGLANDEGDDDEDNVMRKIATATLALHKKELEDLELLIKDKTGPASKLQRKLLQEVDGLMLKAKVK